MPHKPPKPPKTLLNDAQKGTGLAMWKLGKWYHNHKDYINAMMWYLEAADKGYVPAMYEVGVLRLEGPSVLRNYGLAMQWYRKAADKGHTDAMLNLGLMYENGHGVEQDHGKAMEWYLKAADNGNAGAMCNIGKLYDYIVDYEHAVEWCDDEGNTGLFCPGYRARGVEPDYGKAMEWYLKAADKGDVVAMFSIGELYDNGHGVEQDHSKAVQWYRKANDKGNWDAMFCLAVDYTQAMEAADKGEWCEQQFGAVQGSQKRPLAESQNKTQDQPQDKKQRTML